MNICITPESIKLFSAYFKKEIPNQFTNDISANALLNKLFDKALSDFSNTGLPLARNRELILQHLSVAPQMVKQYVGETPSANNTKLVEDLNKLSSEIYNATQSDNKSDFQNVINKLAQIIGKTTLVIPGPPALTFNAISLDLFKTANQEMIYEDGIGYRGNVTSPEKQFEFAVQRQIINSSNGDNLQFRLVKQGELDSLDFIKNTNKDSSEEAYVLVLVDKAGNIVKFDEKGNLSDEGQAPILTFRQNKFDLSFWIKERTESLIARGSSIENASLQVQQEVTGYLELIDAMKQKHASGEVVNFSINMEKSSMGVIEVNLHKKTQMNTVANVDQIPIRVKKEGAQDIAVMYIPLFGTTTMPKQSPMFENSLFDITDEELDLLTKLITEPNLQKKGTKRSNGADYQSEMRPGERKEAIYHFHQEKPSSFLFFNKKTFNPLDKSRSDQYFMIINNHKFEAIPENAEAIRQALKTYFTTRTFEEYQYSSRLKNVTPFASFEKTTEVGQLFYGENGKLYITKAPKRNLRIQNVTDINAEINIPVSIENNIVVLGNKSIRQHILDNTNTTIVTNSNNELRGYSTFLAFGVTAKEVSDLDVDDTGVDDDIFYRSLAEANMETEPTEEQKEAAMNWFKTHPLFKVLSLNESLRNKIHEKGPGFVAEFVNSSINLYLGSNNTDIYHEAFHAFTQAILTKAERTAMYSEIAKTPGSFKVTVLGKAKTVNFSEATDLEIEEYLAEKFREYSMNRGKSKLSVRVKQFFDKVLNMLQGLFGKNMTFNEAIALNKTAGVVNTMFNALYEGNIDVSKFNPQATKTALYKSSEINVKNNANVILPIGTSGSGKSTWIKSINSDNEFEVISPDAMRVEFAGDMNDKSKDEEIYKEAAARTIQAIKNGKKVIFDTTNLTKEKRRPFIKAIKEAIPGANIQYKLMPLDAELAKQRIKADIEAGVNRANVSSETIDRHAKSYKQMLKDITSEDISVYEDIDFSLEEINVLMESMQSLMSEFIDYKTSGVFDKKINKQIAALQIESASYKIGTKKHDAVLKRIEKLKSKVGVVNGYGMFAVAKSPEILESALTFIKNKLIQQRNIIKSSVKDDQNFALVTLNKAIEAFGNPEEAMFYLGTEESTNLIGLFLNNYSTVQIDQVDEDYYDKLDDEERALAYTFGRTGTEQSLAERTDSQTKQLLSSIHAHYNNGKGGFVVNALGVKKIQPFVQMLAKTSKILRNTTDRVEMYKKLVEAAKKDFEIAQILAKLGDITNPNITQDEIKAWLAFGQVMNKTDLFLREFIIEKVVKTDYKTKSKTVRLESRSGRAKAASNRVGADWADNFVYISSTGGDYFTEREDGKYGLDAVKLATAYNEKGFGLITGTETSQPWLTNKTDIALGDKYTGKLVKAAAFPFEFLKELGIELVNDPLVREILETENNALGINVGILENIQKSLMNRQYAVLEKDKFPTSLKQVFEGYDYLLNGEKFTQNEMNGWFTQLQTLQYFFSDENSSSMGKNAEGENQSEKSDTSSLTVMVNGLNDAKHYNEILNKPGLEMFNVDVNPFAAASAWLINMFNLDSKDPAIRGTRAANFKITLDSLSGSKIIFENDDKGSGTMKLDEKAKFITDFDLTLQGKPEISRMADKSTSLTAYVPIKKNGRIIKNQLEISKDDVDKIFTPAYDLDKNSTLLYNQFYRHIEAELVRISRLNDAMDDLKSEKEIVFDAAYLKRGRQFYMFANILSKSTKARLLELNISESEVSNLNGSNLLNNVISKELKKNIDLDLKNYFEKKSNGLFNRKNKQLTISNNLFESYQKSAEEDIDVTRKRMFKTFVINNFIQTANFSSLFIGDAAVHDVAGEGYHKRIAGLISTGKIFANDSAFLNYVNKPNFKAFGFAENHNQKQTGRSYSGYINSGVIKEKKTSSVYLKQWNDLIDTKDYGTKNKMKEADGAGWISFDMYRILNLACGEWSDAQDAVYKKMLDGETLTEQDRKVTFPMRKFQYFGPVSNESAAYNLQMMAFHKYSLMPLIPALIEGTPLQDLHEKMMEQGVDYVTMESGSKVSSISKVELEVDKESNELEPVGKFDDFYDDERKTNDIEFTVNKIHSAYLKNQIYLAPGYKGKITLPTQKRKIIALGLFDQQQIPTDYKPTLSETERTEEWNGLSESKRRRSSKNYDWYKRYEIVISKIQAHLKKELLEDLGLSYDASGKLTGTPKKLVAYLEKQMKSNDMLSDDIDYIISVSKNAETLDFSLSMYSEKIEAILMTLADKKLRALNVNGEALVQVPGTMFENKQRATDFAKIENPTEADIFNYGTNGLSFYHVTDKNGNPVLTEDTKSWIVKSMEVKISLQGSFKKLLYLNHFDGKKIAIYTKDAAGNSTLDYNASLNRLNESIRNKEWNTKHAEFLQIAGDRIPSQGPNALESITVAEFLPEWAGPIIILPAEIVAKAGSDYDIDKLFTQFPNIVVINGKVEMQQYLGSTVEDSAELFKQIKSLNQEKQAKLKPLYAERQNAFKLNDEFSKEAEVYYEAYVQTSNELDAAYLEMNKINSFNYPSAVKRELTESFVQDINRLESLLAVYDVEISRVVDKYFTGASQKDLDGVRKAIKEINSEIRAVREEYEPKIENLERKFYGSSIKGLENEMLSLFTEKITLSSNIKDLITTNSTDIALPIAKKMEASIRKRDGAKKFNKYERIVGVNGEVNDESEDGISGTTIFDYEYNLLKQQENSVGKDSLGIAAVTATYYAMFQTFGAKLNAVSASKQAEFDKQIEVLARVSEIELQIAEIEDLYDDKLPEEARRQINNLTRQLPSDKTIAYAQDVVNKFKDFSFKLDHNKLKSVLGEHIALGISKNTKGQSISDLLSQMINGYVDVAKDAWVFNMQGNKQNTPTLLFMVMAGVSLESATYLSSTPLVMEYNQYKKELSGVYSTLNLDPDVNPIVKNNKINQKAQQMIYDNHPELFGNVKDFNYKSYANRNSKPFTEDELEKLVGQSKIDLRQLEALSEYIHIEKIASDVSKFQQLTRFDTNKISTISEAQKRIDDIVEFKSRNTFTPAEWFEARGIGNTPVGQFNNDSFLIDLFERYFSLRNNPALVKVSLDQTILDNKPKGTVDVVLRTDFKNDFIWFLYQNSLFKKNVYGDYNFKPNYSDPNAPFTIDETTKTISFGGALLSNDINNPELELKYVQKYFTNLDQYVRFKIEYLKLEKLDIDKLRKQYYFLDKAKNKYTDVYFKQKIALYNSRNHNSYFTGPTNVGIMFKRFKQQNPDLVEKYALIRDMKFNDDEKTKKSNMYLLDIEDVNLRKQYKENLANLRGDERPEIAEFFGLFNNIAMMQTGLNRRSQYDLGKIVDAEHLHETIENGLGIGKMINELNQIETNLKNALLNNADRTKPMIEADLQVLGQFKDLFISMLEGNYRLRVRGHNYQVANLKLGKTIATPETILSFNNVEIKSSLVGLPKDTLALFPGLFFDEEGEYTPEEFAELIKDKKLAILNQKLIVPVGEDQKAFDKLLLDYFGIDNSGEFPVPLPKSKTAQKGFLSIAGLGLDLIPIHSIKDEAMANASTVAIGQATIVNPKARSSSQKYVDELTAKYPGKLAGKGTRFKSTDVVWVFGSGVFASRIKNVSIEEFQIALDNTFNSYHKPNIDKAIKAGVKTFNVGTASGIDQMAVDYLEEQGFVKVSTYAAVGKYYQMRKSTSSFEDLDYDINSPAVTAESLEATDLIDFLIASNGTEKWYSDLTEEEKFKKGVAVVYDKIANQLNRNIKYKIQFANALAASKGPILIKNSAISAVIEQALYKMKADILKHRMGVSVKAPVIIEPLSFEMEIGSFVKYNGQTYIVTQFNADKTIQIYNPLLEGAAAKISVAKRNLETLSNKAKIVNYRNTDYIVTPKGTIISLETNKAMKWLENDGNRVAVLTLANESSKSSAGVEGINISTKSSDKLGRELTNPNWGAKNIMDIEAEYKANASKIKAPELTMDEALKYDMNLMYKLQIKKFKAHPELVKEITDRGGVKFLEASEHTVGVKGSRWEGKGNNSNFIKVLIKSYQDSLNNTQLSTSVKVISEDYGVVQAETNPTETEKKADIDLIKEHISKQTFKENVGQYANEMFHYSLRWGRKSYNFFVLKDGKYIKSTLNDEGSQLYGKDKYGAFIKSNRTDKAAYNNGLLNPLDIDSFAGKGDMYGYDLVDQNGNPLPSIKDLQPIIDKIEAAIGIDMKDYDSVIGNIYLPGEYVYPHKDTSESKSARNYPVIVYSIGNDAGLGIVDNNEGKMTFANQYDERFLPANDKLKGYTNEILTKHGSIYTFGMDGKGRFELTHSTPTNSKKDKPQVPITLPSGKVVTNYTITLTFRRAADLEPGMPTAPVKINASLKNSKVKDVTVPQNRISGINAQGSTQQANAKAKQMLGSSPHSIDMIDAGLRTRTTRSVGEMDKYNIEVGDVVIQSGKSANGAIKNVFTKITAIHPKGTADYLGTWSKEGWTEEGVTEIERYKAGAAAIEFEVIRYTGTLPMETFLSLPLTEQKVMIEQQLKC